MSYLNCIRSVFNKDKEKGAKEDGLEEIRKRKGYLGEEKKREKKETRELA